LTSADLLAALRLRYAPPEWYLVSEVPNGTGYTEKRRSTFADAVAISAYQGEKTGGEIHGFELKVSRTDWKNELADPGKAAEVRKFCDRWWLVVPAPVERIVHYGELPEGWGLLHVGDGKARQMKEAPRLTNAWARPELPRSFIAALVRRASEEQAEKEARKGALLKAPIRQIAIGSFGSTTAVLVCGHMLRIRAGTMPKAARCLACVDGLPPAIDLVHEALRKMNVAELRRVGEEALGRAQRIEAGHWSAGGGDGISPRVEEEVASEERPCLPPPAPGAEDRPTDLQPEGPGACRVASMPGELVASAGAGGAG
jgi:hypothetical protein